MHCLPKKAGDRLHGSAKEPPKQKKAENKGGNKKQWEGPAAGIDGEEQQRGRQDQGEGQIAERLQAGEYPAARPQERIEQSQRRAQRHRQQKLAELKEDRQLHPRRRAKKPPSRRLSSKSSASTVPSTAICPPSGESLRR